MDWFRSWHGAPTDPKWLVVARKASVPPAIVSAVVWALLDHASQNQNDRGSVIAFDVETYAAFSGLTEDQVGAIIAALTDKGVIQDGRLANWAKRQPAKEDPTAAERQRRRRARDDMDEASRAVTPSHADVTQPHAPEQNREEQSKTDTEGRARRVDGDEAFKRFWLNYPKRDGANPKEPARKKFLAFVKAGLEPEAIVDGASRYAEECQRKSIAGTDKVAQAVTFLNQRRWEDYPAAGATAGPAAAGWFYAKADSEELLAWDKHRGRAYPRDKNGGWFFPTQWPPDQVTAIPEAA